MKASSTQLSLKTAVFSRSFRSQAFFLVDQLTSIPRKITYRDRTDPPTITFIASMGMTVLPSRWTSGPASRGTTGHGQRGHEPRCGKAVSLRATGGSKDNAGNADKLDIFSRSGLLRGLTLGLVGSLPAALVSESRAEFVEPEEVVKLLCDATCEEGLAGVERVRLPSGLEFQDIKVGTGPAPPVGYQVVLHYILMTKDGRVISNSLQNGTPYDIRVGTGQVVGGLDEGLKTMRVGGIRRIYVPEGELSFPKGLPSAPGRPRVAPGAPVIFDVQLLYVPGLEDEE